MINNEDIEKIKLLLDDNTNGELKDLVLKLIDERNQLLETANIDELTRVNNRRVLNNNIRYDVVVMCDIDNFKLINDNYGHIVGDEVLKLVSQMLNSMTRDNDFVCRYGGDEFAIILNKCSAEDAIKKLDAIRRKINFVIDELEIDEVTISFGLTEYENGKALIDAIQEADNALYQSKQDGKNRVTRYKKNKELIKK